MQDNRKEDYQFSYLAALCSAADIDLERKYHDRDSVDAEISKKITIDGCIIRSCIHVQLKCTSSLNRYQQTDDTVSFSLPIKNYNDMRLPGPTFLLMVLVIPDGGSPLHWTEEKLLMRGTMYYMNLIGFPSTSNRNTIAISISKANIVNVDVLNVLMRRAGTGEI